MKRWLCISVIAALCPFAMAQTDSDTTVATKVAVIATKQLGVLGPIARSDVQCDREGSIYLPFNPPHKDRRLSGLLKLSADGSKQAIFYNGIGGFMLDAETFGPNGEVVMLPNSRHSWLLHFDASGKLESRAEFQYGGIAAHLALFPNGNMLISFRKNTEPVTGIYDAQGRLLKYVKIPDDEQIELDLAKYGLYYDPYGIDSGITVSGPDGNVYLMRYDEPAYVYTIDASGTIVHRLKIRSPLDGLMPQNMQVRDGMVLTLFGPDHWGEFSTRFLSIVDWETGETLKLYDLSSVSGNGVWSCYDPSSERLTFMRSGIEDNVLSMIYAQPVPTSSRKSN